MTLAEFQTYRSSVVSHLLALTNNSNLTLAKFLLEVKKGGEALSMSSLNVKLLSQTQEQNEQERWKSHIVMSVYLILVVWNRKPGPHFFIPKLLHS